MNTMPIDFSGAPLLNGRPLLTKSARTTICNKMQKDQSSKRAYKNAFTREQKNVPNAPAYALRKKKEGRGKKPLSDGQNRISKGINSRKIYYVSKPYSRGTYTRVTVRLQKDFIGENVLKYIRNGQIRRVKIGDTSYGTNASKQIMKNLERRVGVWSSKPNHIMDLDIEKGPGWKIMTVSATDLTVMQQQLNAITSKTVQGVLNRKKAYANFTSRKYDQTIPKPDYSVDMQY